MFPPEALARVRLIRGALSIGFSVAELTAIDHGNSSLFGYLSCFGNCSTIFE